MQYAWFVFAVLTALSFGGIFSDIATALTLIAKAWDRYFSENTPDN